MARHIDDSKPLSREDRQWLQDWGRTAEIERIDAKHGVTAEDVAAEQDSSGGDTTADALRQLLRDNGVDPGNSDEDLMGALQIALSGRRGDPLGNGQQVVAPGESGSFAPGQPNGEDTGDDSGDYADWTVPELQEELGNRELSKSGNKKDLIARLREDDAAGEE